VESRAEEQSRPRSKGLIGRRGQGRESKIGILDIDTGISSSDALHCPVLACTAHHVSVAFPPPRRCCLSTSPLVSKLLQLYQMEMEKTMSFEYLSEEGTTKNMHALCKSFCHLDLPRR
jgi:hypothetical protein